MICFYSGLHIRIDGLSIQSAKRSMSMPRQSSRKRVPGNSLPLGSRRNVLPTDSRAGWGDVQPVAEEEPDQAETPNMP